MHDLHIWSLTSGSNSLTVHLVADAPDPALVQKAQQLAAEHTVEHASIQLDAAQSASEAHIHGLSPAAKAK